MNGFDCSGFVIEVMKSVGKLPREGDWTANGILDYFSHRKVKSPEEGCLVFWVNDAEIAHHVEYCLNDELSIGASGGGSKTKTHQDAIDQNAYIKIRPIYGRRGNKVYVDPFKDDWHFTERQPDAEGQTCEACQ